LVEDLNLITPGKFWQEGTRINTLGVDLPWDEKWNFEHDLSEIFEFGYNAGNLGYIRKLKLQPNRKFHSTIHHPTWSNPPGLSRPPRTKIIGQNLLNRQHPDVCSPKTDSSGLVWALQAPFQSIWM